MSIRTFIAAACLLLPLACTAVDPEAHEPFGALDAWRATNATVHERRAEAALARGDSVEALQSAREALRVAPDRPETLMLLAHTLLHARRPDEAEAIAGRASDARPNDPECWLLLGECLTALERARDANDCYVEAARLGSADATLVIGANAIADGGDEAALGALLDAPGGASTPAQLGVLSSHRWRAGRVDEAAELVDRAFALAPDDPLLRLRRDELRLELEQDLSGTPESPADGTAPEVRMLFAAKRLAAGDPEGAAEQYRRTAQDLPGDAIVRVALGEALLGMNDRDGAASAFRSAQRLDPSCLEAWVGGGRAELGAGRAAAAMSALDQAVKLDPDHLPTRSLLVAASVAAGDHERARAEADEVRTRSPGSRLDRACRELLSRFEGRATERH